MINLIYNYYKTKEKLRQDEIDFCLQKNLSNKYLNVIIIELQTNPTYNYLFNKINQITSDNDVNIICNSDIFFDESINLCNNIKQKECYALSRWDYKSELQSIFFNRSDSQDTWIFRGKIENVNGNFCLGMPGCDNRIAYEINKQGYKITNPSKTIKTYHVHNSNIRQYNKKDTISGPYLNVHPI